MSFAKNTLTMPASWSASLCGINAALLQLPFFLIYLFPFNALNTMEVIAISGRHEVIGEHN